MKNNDLQKDASAEISVSVDPWRVLVSSMPFGLTGAVLWLALMMLAQYGAQQAVDREWLATPTGWPPFTYNIAVMIIFTGALLVFWKFKRAPLSSLGFSLKRLPGDLLFALVAALLMALFYGLAGLCVWGYFQIASDTASLDFRQFLHNAMFSDLSFGYVLGVVVLYPIFEEIWFRGVLYPPMRKELGRAVAIVLSSVLFALAHANAFPINQFVGGLVFVIAYEMRRTLVAPILLHMAGNGSLALMGWLLPLMEWL